MAKHGNSKSQKRISAPTATNILRKEFVWTVKTSPGPHSGKNSVPLGIVLRNLLHVSRNAKETKIVLNKRQVSVDGIIRTSHKFPVGLFDVVALSELKKQFRVLLDAKGRFFLKEIPAKNSGFKIVKVNGKRAVEKKKIQLETNDGRTLLIEPKQKTSVGDSLKISLPEQKVLEIFNLEKGNLAFVFTGKRIGAIAEIIDILPGTMKRGKLAVLKPSTGEQFQTVTENLFVVGKKKPEVEIA